MLIISPHKQSLSSLQSGQSLTPSHLALPTTHCSRLEHLNSSAVQLTVDRVKVDTFLPTELSTLVLTPTVVAVIASSSTIWILVPLANVTQPSTSPPSKQSTVRSQTHLPGTHSPLPHITPPHSSLGPSS